MVESIEELRKICQPPSIQAVFPYRKGSIYFTKIFLYTSITANQVTILFAICGVTSGILYAIGNYWWSLFGSVILLIHYVLDYVDGEVARYRKNTSHMGQFMDILCHDIVFAIVFSGIGYNFYQISSNSLILFMSFATPSLVVLTFSIYGFQRLIRNSQKVAPRDDEKEEHMLKRIFHGVWILWMPFGITHIVTLSSIFDLLNLLFMFYTIITPFWLAIQLYNLMQPK